MELMVFVLTVWRLPRGCGRVGLIWLLALKLQHIEFQIGRVFRGFRHLTCSRFFRMSHTVSPAQRGDPWLNSASRIAFLLLLVSPALASAQPRPLIWCAVPDGGVPHIFLDADGKFAGFE